MDMLLLARAEKEAREHFEQFLAAGIPKHTAAQLAAETVVDDEGKNVERSRFWVYEALLSDERRAEDVPVKAHLVFAISTKKFAMVRNDGERDPRWP